MLAHCSVLQEAALHLLPFSCTVYNVCILQIRTFYVVSMVWPKDNYIHLKYNMIILLLGRKAML